LRTTGTVERSSVLRLWWTKVRTGGIIALGYLFGRSDPGADWTDVSELAAKLKRRFLQEYGATDCGALLAMFGPQENMMRCKTLSGEVAGMLADIIEGYGQA